jgi:hypothetical protein
MAGVSDITGYQTFGPFSNYGGYAGSSSTTSGVGGVGAYHHHHQNQAGEVPQPGNESKPPVNEASDLLKLFAGSGQTNKTSDANRNSIPGQILDLFA